jgi:hypothetical protein
MFVSLSSSMADRLYSSLLILAVYTVSRRTCPVDNLLHVATRSSVVHCKCGVGEVVVEGIVRSWFPYAGE